MAIPGIKLPHFIRIIVEQKIWITPFYLFHRIIPIYQLISPKEDNLLIKLILCQIQGPSEETVVVKVKKTLQFLRLMNFIGYIESHIMPV